MQKKVVLIKLGGSIITNKEVPMSLREDVLVRLVKEIAKARKERPDVLFVMGHGSGSFAHVPAHKYKTMDGFINDESRIGMAIVQDTAAQLNRIVVKACIEQGIPAVSLYASNTIVTASRKPQYQFPEVFEQYLRNGLFPVTAGDVLVDIEQGCTIWSTEEILSFFAREFIHRGWEVENIIHVTEVEGVLDEKKQIIPTITVADMGKVVSSITSTKGFDVTGGMMLKVTESVELAKLHISSFILSGLEKNNLYNALVGKEWKGTKIR